MLYEYLFTQYVILCKMFIYLNTFLWDIFVYVLIIIIYIIPIYLVNLESFDNLNYFWPEFFNTKVLSLTEGIDELMDSWSDSAGADETSDSSSTLVFGSCFISINTQGALSFIPLCTNACSDLNIMLMFCEDCVLGTLISLVPIIGFRTYAESINKDIPLLCIPIFIFCEIMGQTMRVISLSLRMAANVTAGHNLFFIILSYAYIFIIYTIKLKYQLVGLILIAACLGFLCLDTLISTVQSYVIIVLETYYELDSE